MCFIGLGRAQVDQQFWMNYAVTVPTSTKWSYGGDIGIRGLFSNYDWSQVLIRPSATYRFNSTFSAQGAVAVFKTLNKKDNNLTEFRMHQDLNIRWPKWDAVSPFFRLRIEERFFFYQNISNDFNMRIRFLAGATSRDFVVFSEKRPVYFQTILEGFLRISAGGTIEQFINQSRMHFAFGQKLSSSVRYELHYIWQRSRLFRPEGNSASQNIFRIRVFHRINRKKLNQ